MFRPLCDSGSSVGGDRQSERSIEVGDAWTGRHHANHIPCGATCKLCRRIDTSANPFISVPGKVTQPMIPWRRAQGRLCAICPWAIEHDETGQYKNKDVDALEQELQDDEAHNAFMDDCIIPYQEKKNLAGGKRLSSSTTPKANIQVAAKEYQDLSYSKCIGILWPVLIYKKHHEKAPSSKKLQTHLIEGKKVRGILLPKSMGTLFVSQ